MRLISSARITLAKIGPFDELHPPPPAADLFQDLRAGDVGRHQIGRELDALKLEMKDLGDRAHQQRLRQARRPGDQAVPPANRLISSCSTTSALADDDFGQFRVDPLPAGADLLDGLLFHFVRVDRRCSRWVPRRWIRALLSMRHGIDHDIDSQRIGLFLGELLKVPGILAFALPAVAQVGVVADDRHHPSVVVEDAR